MLPLTEKDFSRTVLELAQTLGWRCYHTWGSIHSAGGFPDLCMVRGLRLVFAELKGSMGKLSEEQALWLKALRETGQCEAYLWRPEGWEDIVRILT